MKRITVALIGFSILFCLASCRQDGAPEASTSESSVENPPAAQTEVWTSPGSTICAWFSGDSPDDSMGVNTDPEAMRVGITPSGEDVFTLLHFPMRGTWLGDEIYAARLYLKITDGEAPSSLRVGLIKYSWGAGITTLADAQNMIGRDDAEPVAAQTEQDGWISVDVTSCVISWLNGDTPNYGIALFGENSGEQFAFSSGWDESSENPPRLEVTGAVGNRDLSYGRFAYIRHPENESDDAAIAENEIANCLSYALRDINLIGTDDLGLDYGEMTRIYRESGEGAVADYCAERVISYVEEHKSGLKISGFRQINDFDSEIDVTKEYRIAFRVGCKLYDDEDVLDEVAGNFDFHLWMQFNTGQWAQKFMFEPTEIVPCTPPGVSPVRYPWDAEFSWGNAKFAGFYTSKIIYFAVTKDADGFTEHKSE